MDVVVVVVAVGLSCLLQSTGVCVGVLSCALLSTSRCHLVQQFVAIPN